MTEIADAQPALRPRLARFWYRHRTLFWTLHSIWALIAGILVLLVTRERYEFVPWVIAFLMATWASTLYFGRRMRRDGQADQDSTAPGIATELTSYLTRAMYQQTLFFLLPFYWSSTVIESPNILFVVALGCLAVFSCVELVFDRWLRARPVFGLVFFATVSFAALNLLLPLLLPMDPKLATPLSAGLAVGSAVPLTVRGSPAGWKHKLRFLAAGVVLLGIGIGLPQLVPPVPLRLQKAVFSSDINRQTLVPIDTLSGRVASLDLEGRLIVLVEVFAPSIVPTHVRFEWARDGEVVRQSREIEITAHKLGFRVWDGYRPQGGLIAPGLYEITLRTGEGRFFGRAEIVVR